MLSMPPATMISAPPATSASCARMTACMPEPHILLTVVAATCAPRPAKIAACRSGACPTPALKTCPMMICSMAVAPERFTASRTAAAPSSGAFTGANTPCRPPMGVRAYPVTMIGSWLIDSVYNLTAQESLARKEPLRASDEMTETTHDAVIIGGGHNGLVCAFYLARAGLKVHILERRGIVGGAAVTEEFHPGFRNSVASYTVSLLNPKVIRDLALAQHGLRIVERRIANFLPLDDGRYLKVGGGRTKDEVAKFSERDAGRLDDYHARLDAIADVLRAV